jgi:SAM-dependent methyltransferase
MNATRSPRRNLIDCPGEAFRSPLFKTNRTLPGRIENYVRRFFDLQAASIWRDLKPELAQTAGVVLDVGCGAQVYRNLLGKGAAYQGIDTHMAKDQFGYESPDTTYFEGEEWPVAEASVDCVLCTEVLEHIPDSLRFLRQIQTCLRPGGRLLLTVPFAARWHFIPRDYWRFTPSGLSRLLAQAGFMEVRVYARGNPLTVACYKVMALPLMLLFSDQPVRAKRVLKRIMGLLLSPGLVLAACVGNGSLLLDWGEDCLGYTVSARRAP